MVLIFELLIFWHITSFSEKNWEKFFVRCRSEA